METLSIIQEIIYKKEKIYKILKANKYALIDEQILLLSQELDELIVSYIQNLRNE